MLPRLVCPALALMLAAACGSTVPLSQQAVTGSSEGLSAQAAAAPGLGTAPSDGSTATSSQDLPTATGPRGGAAGSVPSTATALSGTAPTKAVSKNLGAVRVGVLYLTGADKFASTLGISGLQTGDTEAQGKALIDYANAHGGLAGRRIVAYNYGISASESSSDPGRAQQVACASLTQDSKVAFVVSMLTLQPNTLSCFAKAKVPVLDDVAGLPTVSDQLQQWLYSPGDIASARMVDELVEALWRAGWLTKASKIGSYTWDFPEHQALVEHALVPALARHGLTIAVKTAVSNGADGVSQSSNAALKYRAAGVDRIIPVLANPLFVMTAASSQGYRPKYALYSTFGPGALMESVADKDQLEGAYGIGWQPYLDIGSGTHPGPVSSNESLCFAIMKAAGQDSTSATTRGLQTNMCNVVFYLQEATRVTTAATSAALAQAGGLLRTGFKPADTFRIDVSRRHDGVGGYRDLAYQTGCSCFQYVGGVRPTH